MFVAQGLSAEAEGDWVSADTVFTAVRSSRLVGVSVDGQGSPATLTEATGGQLDLTDGEVSFHEVGADVIDPTFDLARISSGVVYRFNSQKLVATVVPLPPISPPLR